MNNQKYLYNTLVRFYKLSLRKLKRLLAYGKNLRKQQILKKRLLRLQKQLSALAQRFKPQLAKVALVGTLLAGQVDGVSAQTFSPINISGLHNLSDRSTIPNLVDLDGDGDLDLFDTAGFGNDSCAFHLNTGSANSPSFSAPIWTPFSLSPFSNGGSTTYYGTNVTFADLDGDTDFDILTIDKNTGKFIYFENDGTPQNPHFSTGQLNPFSLLTPELNGIPSLGDLDNDGDLDLMVKISYGDIHYYENTGTNTIPNFTNSILNPFNLTTLFVLTRSNSLNDIDLDGDLDILLGVYDYSRFIFFENIGDPSNPQFQFKEIDYDILNINTGGMPSFYFSYGDLDADGDLDFITNNSYYDFDCFINFERSRDMAFEVEQINPFGLSNIGSGKLPHLVDIDADGDLDIFHNFHASFKFFENNGTSTNPVFSTSVLDPFSLNTSGYYYISTAHMDFTDIDQDGDFDIIVSAAYPNPVAYLYYFENIGTPQNPNFANPHRNLFGSVTQGFAAVQDLAFGDIDADGDIDMLGNIWPLNNYDPILNPYEIIFFRNTGTQNTPIFNTREENPFPSVWNSFTSNIDFHDTDSDGDLDILFGNGNFVHLENSGTANSPLFVTQESAPFLLSPQSPFPLGSTLGDLNGDGTVDILSSTSSGNLLYFQGIPCPLITSILPDSICGSGAINLQATSSNGNLTWYDAQNGGTVVGTGNSLNIPNITQTTSYWVEAQNSSCTSPRIEIEAKAGPCTGLRLPYCNRTLTNFNDYMACTAVSGATNYRFELDDGTNTYTYDSPTVGFRMNLIPGAKYGTTYQVRVAAKTNGVWGAFSTGCSVTTPLTKIQPWYCGLTVSPMNQYLACYTVAHATQYKFKLFDGTNTLYYTSNSIGFRMSWVPGMQINTTYSVSVSAKVNGTWSAYGNSCNITSAGSFLELQNTALELEDSLQTDVFYLHSDPNPSAGSFRLSASHSGEFTILNELGQVIQTLLLTPENDNSIDVVNLETGIYFITGILNEEKVTKKVIVLN